MSTLNSDTINATSNDMGRRRALTGALTGFAGLASLAVAGAAQAQNAAPSVMPAKPLKGKVAIITGARNNQGRAYAIALAKMGADLVLHYHRAETLDQVQETERLVRAEGARTVLVQGDLGEVANVRRVFDAAQNTYKRADILVHTVGLIIKKPMADVTEADYERSQRANTKSTFFCMAEAGKRLTDNGRIIAIGTSLTAGAAPGYALYAGTKAPVEEFTRMLAKEIGKRGITVNCVAPGPLDNSFFHAAETPQSAAYAASLSMVGRLGKESDITPLVEYLASAGSQWTTGTTHWVNGGYLTR
jgi:NAD(P)-dependent dehydrogenase (short-subunit alcohol dehydrogenase family)